MSILFAELYEGEELYEKEEEPGEFKEFMDTDKEDLPDEGDDLETI